jgi:hypothetical protein
MVRIEILAVRAKVSSISTQGRQIMMKPLETVIEREAKQCLSRGYDGAVKIGATQIKLATKLLGDRWMEILRRNTELPRYGIG